MGKIVVKVHNGYFFKGKQALQTNTGKTLVIKAKNGASYELIDLYTKKAPENLLVERRGQDLLVAVENKENVDLLIKNFFLYPESQLVGLAQDGTDSGYYSYLPIQDKYEAFFGKDLWLGTQDSGAQQVALGNYGKITPWIVEAETQPMFSLIKPVLASLGVGGLVLLGIESWKKDNTETIPEPPTGPKPKQPTAKVADDGKTVTGKAEAGAKITVSDQTGELGSATVNDKGQYTLTLNKPKLNGEALTVVAIKDNAKSEALSIFSVDKVDPEAAKSVSINDEGLIVTGEAEKNTTVQVLDKHNNVIGTGQTDETGKFSVKLLQAQSHKEALTVQVLDKAKRQSKAVKLTGSAGENDAISEVIDIDVTNKKNTVSESDPIGATVGITAKASDYEAVTYRLAKNGDGAFKIDAQTGVVTTAKKLDFESKSKYSIDVVASSADGTNRTKTFDIHVTNANDNKIEKIIDADKRDNVIGNDAKIGDDVGFTAKATDPDGDKISYKMTNNPDGLFGINADTGVVTVAKSLTGMTGDKSITIQATSADKSTTTTDTVISIKNPSDIKKSNIKKSTENPDTKNDTKSESDSKNETKNDTKSDETKTIQGKSDIQSELTIDAYANADKQQLTQLAKQIFQTNNSDNIDKANQTTYQIPDHDINLSMDIWSVF